MTSGDIRTAHRLLRACIWRLGRRATGLDSASSFVLRLGFATGVAPVFPVERRLVGPARTSLPPSLMRPATSQPPPLYASVSLWLVGRCPGVRSPSLRAPQAAPVRWSPLSAIPPLLIATLHCTAITILAETEARNLLLSPMNLRRAPHFLHLPFHLSRCCESVVRIVCDSQACCAVDTSRVILADRGYLGKSPYCRRF